MRRLVDDAGEKIGGARKDWRERRMTASDVLDMTEVEAVRLVTKERAFPVPDWRAMIEAGAEPRAIACLKIMRDAIGARPNVRKVEPRQASALYVEECDFIARLFQEVRTEADVRGLIGKITERHNWSDLSCRNDPLVAQAMWGVLRGTTRSHPLSYTHKVVQAAQSLLDGGWPDEVPAWLSGVSLRDYGDGKIVIKKGSRIIASGFKTPEEAKQFLRSQHDESKAKKAEKNGHALTEPQRPHLSELKRLRPYLPEIAETVISPDTFLETFGFRAIEFGEWLPDAERGEVLKLGYWALRDLADVIGVEPVALGLEGTLAVAFGARGKGGMAAAHFEPARRVLNLTRIRGAGSLAHEYGHALDNWLGRVGLGQETEGDNAVYASGGRVEKALFARDQVLTVVPAIGKAMSVLMHAIWRTPLTEEELERDKERRLASLRSALLSQQEEIEKMQQRAAALGRQRVGAKSLREAERRAMGIQTAIDAISEATTLVRSKTRQSDFITEARKLCGKTGEYWLRPTELFARSFECWVFDQLQEKGERSDYLVHGVEEDRYTDNLLYKGNPYPVSEERRRISAAMNLIIEVTQKCMSASLVQQAIERRSTETDELPSYLARSG